MKPYAVRIIQVVDDLGFALITGSILYFIIGSAATLVDGTMLDWTFCGMAHRLFDVEWCGIDGSANELPFDYFIHRLLNAPLAWFMIFWGFALVAICSAFFTLLGYRRTPPGAQR